MGDAGGRAQHLERGFGFALQTVARRALRRRQDLHRHFPRQSGAPADRGTLGDQRSAQRQRRQERHHRDHHVERRGAFFARHDSVRGAHGRDVLNSTSLPSTSRISRARDRLDQRAVMGGDEHGGAQPVQFGEQAGSGAPRFRDRHCRSARRRSADRAGPPRRGRWRRAAARRPTASAAWLSAGRPARPRRAIPPHRGRNRDSRRPAIRKGSATLSKAERWSSRRKSWNTTPMRRRKRREGGALGGGQIVSEQGDQPARRRLGEIDQFQQSRSCRRRKGRSGR